MRRFLAMMLMAAMLMSCAVAEDVQQSNAHWAWKVFRRGEYEAGIELLKYADVQDGQLDYVLGMIDHAEDLAVIGDGVLSYRFCGLWGVMNLDVAVLTEPRWESIERLNADGLAKVMLNGKVGCINAQGETVIDCEWDAISGFFDGLCTVQKGVGNNARFGLMNAAGEVVAEAKWRQLGDSVLYGRNVSLSVPYFVNDRMVVGDVFGLYGLMDKAGVVRGKICWDNAPDLMQELPLVSQNGLYGFIDLDGNVVIEPQYMAAMPFSEGLAAVSADGWLFQFVDRDNNMVVPPVYEEVTSFANGSAYVKQPGMSWQVIDRTGQLVYFVTDTIRMLYDMATVKMAEENYADAATLFSGTIGYLDSYDQFLEAQRLALLKEAYDAAGEMFLKGNYAKAIELYAQAGDYADAKQKHAEVQEEVYLKAVATLEAEEYKAFIHLCSLIPGYRDVDDLLATTDTDAYSVIVTSLGEYGFDLNAEGFYESTNQGVPNSFSMCKVEFKTITGYIYIDYIYSAEAGKDIAIISELDKTLAMNSATDEQNVETKPGIRRSNGMQTVKIEVPDGDMHSICIKFKKNPKTDVGADSFQFRIRFE